MYGAVSIPGVRVSSQTEEAPQVLDWRVRVRRGQVHCACCMSFKQGRYQYHCYTLLVRGEKNDFFFFFLIFRSALFVAWNKCCGDHRCPPVSASSWLLLLLAVIRLSKLVVAGRVCCDRCLFAFVRYTTKNIESFVVFFLSFLFFIFFFCCCCLPASYCYIACCNLITSFTIDIVEDAEHCLLAAALWARTVRGFFLFVLLLGGGLCGHSHRGERVGQ